MGDRTRFVNAGQYVGRKIGALARLDELIFSREDIVALIDYVCSIAIRQKIHYLWRPRLRDAADEMVLEVAVAAHCDYIMTFNKKDFAGSEQFGVFAITPKEFFTILAKPR